MKTFSGNRASQRDDEIFPFIKALVQRDVRSYLEIGAREGDTFHAIMTSLPVGSLGVAVDLPGGPWGKSTTARLLQLACCDLRKRGYAVKNLFGDSQEQSTLDWVKAISTKYDAVLIDGDHRYDGVKKDWEMYGPLSNDMVAFHDIDGEGIRQKTSGLPVEVPRLWRELKPQYAHVEFIGQLRGMGIGLLWKK